VPGPTLSAVIVNLDGGPLVDACLDALTGQGVDEVIVVDNGSAPPEVDRLAARTGLKLVRLTENQGFAGPANRGVAEAAGELVLVLNNDCTLEPGYASACVEALRADPAVVAVQGVVLDGDGLKVDGCGIAWNGRAEAIQIRNGEPPPAPDAPPFPVAGISATAAVYRRSSFLALAGFEESFFAYYEDADLSLRLARAGGRFLCVPAARARHLGSATGRRLPGMRWRRLLQNRIRTLRRNLTPAAKDRALIHSPAPGLRAAARELGYAKALWLAFAAGFETPDVARRDAAALAAHPPLGRLPS